MYKIEEEVEQKQQKKRKKNNTHNKYESQLHIKYFDLINLKKKTIRATTRH